MIKKGIISILIIVITLLNLFLFKSYYENNLQEKQLDDMKVTENQI